MRSGETALHAPHDRHQALRLNLEFGIAKNNGPLGAIVLIEASPSDTGTMRILSQSGAWFSPDGGLCVFHLMTLSAMIFIDVIAA